MKLAADQIADYAKQFGRPGLLEEVVQRNLMSTGARTAIHAVKMSLPIGQHSISIGKLYELLNAQAKALDALMEGK